MEKVQTRFDRRWLLLLVLVIAFKAILEYAYVKFVSVIFAYAGFDLFISFARVAHSYVFVAALTLLIPATPKRPSDFIAFFFLISVLIPTLILYAYANKDADYTYMCLLFFIIMVGVTKLPAINLPKPDLGPGIGLIICLALAVGTSIWLILSGGLANFNLNPNLVYELRASVGQVIDKGIFAYTNTIAFKVAIPVLVGWVLYKKKYIWIAPLLTLSLLFYGVSQHKSVALFGLLPIGIYFLFQFKNSLSVFVTALSGMAVIATIMAVEFDAIFLASNFIRRIYFVPAMLNYEYHAYFSQTGEILMSNSFLSQIYDYPYNVAHPNVIGAYSFGSSAIAANTGILGTSFMHFGYAGMIVFSLVTGFILKLIDWLGSGGPLPVWFAISIVFVPVRSLLISSDFGVSLLTHGLLISLLLLWLFSGPSRIKFASLRLQRRPLVAIKLS